MLIRIVRHKGLKRLLSTDDGRGLDAQALPKLRRVLTTLQAASDIDEMATFPLWRVHRLTGDRRGCWSLSVTGNFRLTFRLDDEGAIIDLDLEDYH